MKRLLYLALALSVIALHGCGPTSVIVQSTPPPAPPPPPPAPPASYQTFYDALSPYGQWINNPEYGYVWMPSVAPDFTPYGSNGHWVYTDQGWTWASDYPWGWAAFHYGRWFFEDGYGWMWIPGNEWAPAWVSWRRSPDYYGWAPLGPQVTINVSNGGGYNPPNHYWHFVPQQYVASPHVNNYVVNQQQNVTIIQNTTVIHNTTINNTTINNTTINNNTTVNNTTNINNVNNRTTVNNYAGGPDPAEVSRVSGTSIRPVPLRESSRPGENAAGGGLAIYRPRINSSASTSGSGAAAPAPPHVQSLNQVRPVNPTSYSNARAVTNPSPAVQTPPGANPNTQRPAGNVAAPPVNMPPVNTPPANTAPVNTQRVNTPPINTPPINTPRVNTPPVNTAPANTAPVNTQRANTPPINTTTGNGTPPNYNHPPVPRPVPNNAVPVRPPSSTTPPPTTNPSTTVRTPASVTKPVNQPPAGNRFRQNKKPSKDSTNNKNYRP